MKVLNFRPFKRLNDEELINKIHETFKCLKSEDKYYKETLAICDQLIKEVKLRNLYYSKERLYNKILFK
ncbi:hypothetical protein FQB35_09550 [Crassaminicella thermophila]|uniref:Uncharacterized protein n=1 Tax=Crassaminicella thermophila TaxID=2599308 RepID=A0A5C0SHX4_CRATE|nr:hypothetical protein [Crassaminicella thermophila]QEK12549.1 hypothetical protein FQB35_09550 [Crassaminicella thermophila]